MTEVDRAALALDSSAAAVIEASLGLDRGILASADDTERMVRAVENFEAVAAVAQEDSSLTPLLAGQWRLVYSSSLDDQGGAFRKVVGQLGQYVGRSLEAEITSLLLIVPAARSALQLGEVSQTIGGDGVLTMEEEISLRSRVPWPLPKAPECLVSIMSDIRDINASGQLCLTLSSVKLRVLTFPAVTLPIASMRKSLPPLYTQRPGQLESGSGRLRVSALSRTVRVMRSGAGDFRVFVRKPEGTPANKAEQLDAAALGNLALARKQAEEKRESEKEELSQKLRLAAATAVALAEEKEDLERTLRQNEEAAAKAATAAAVELQEATRLAEAKVAAVQAVAAAELAEERNRAEEKMAEAAMAAKAQKEQMLAEHTKAITEVEMRAAADVTAAQRELDLAKARAEESTAAAREAFAVEKRVLTQKIVDAEEKVDKAKQAALAAIGNL
eukprot:CAMPEP_0119340860 /NCGR_PEP_ID=MMETSP1333-20130426/101170_1 /TAXON_ID=418940 /ORGANISM="Scyphosphaera apsteinii, Strain RCC1455" /LENGTH=444 /DNA_ID=CAMNT_0007352707 /DNA_START=128 /DNA_END=1462 /DNA_ORIENTATION=+